MLHTFRQQFPFFHDNAWTYLDSAATTLKPQVLIDTTCDFYASAGSVHRSHYDLPQTQAYEQARDLVKQRFNVAEREAIIWTSGTTHSINLVANGLNAQLQAGDEILISIAEHHANFIPWQQLAERTGATLRVLSLNAALEIEPSALLAALNPRTKIVAFNLVSNITGVRQPAEQLIPLIRANSSAWVLLDIAQAVCSEKVDVQALDADFYAFSAHKMYGANGVGVLMGKKASLEQLSPLFFGGKMLKEVDEQRLTLAELPYRLEAGTPNIAGIIGFGKVLEWLESWDFEALNQHLYQLAAQARTRLSQYPQVKLVGEALSPTISFVVEGVHHADLAALLTEQHIAIRHGEHCAKPYVRYLKQAGTLRISLAHYNNAADLAQFFTAFEQALALLAE